MHSKSITPTAIALILSAAAIVSANAQATTRIDLPAQPLSEAIQAVARQANLNILVDPKLVASRQAPAIDGVSAEEALTKILAGTGLTPKFVDDKTITIVAAPAPAPERKTTAPSESDASDGVRGARKQSFWDRFRLAQADLGETASDGTIEKSEAPAEGTEGVKLDEIIVTATKRAQSIRDVPLSMTAVTAEEIEGRGLYNAADYLRGIPGTNQVEGGPFSQSIVIRGIETSPESQNFNSGTTTATYFGETPTTNSAGMAGNSNVDIKLVDIERVEVLRGPQGTAFGNSSLGGAVRTIPVAPRLNQLEGRMAASYSATSGSGGDNYNAHAIGNFPLVTDKLAIRAAIHKYQDSGFYRNRAGSNAAFLATLPAGAAAFAADDDEVGSYDTVGGRVAALFQANEDLKLTLSYLTQKSEMDGIPLANSGTFEQTLLQVAPQHVRRGQKGGLYDMDIAISNATMEYSFGWADLVASYSHINSEAANAFAFGYLGNTLAASGDAFSDHSENVGEVRLATRLDGAWDFLTGLYYEDLNDGDDAKPFQRFYWLGDPATNIFGPGSTFLGTATDKRDLKQKAAFGEVSWRFLTGWTLTGGARAYEYDRVRHFTSSGPLTGLADWTQKASASGTNFRANLSYKPSTSTMLYGGWSQGFRLGRPQNPLPASLCDRDADGIIDGTNNPIESTGTLNSDEVDSYELGGKFTSLDRRLTMDAAVFRMKWSDMPAGLRAPAAPTGCGLNYLLNAGSARSQGVEFQAQFQVSEPFRVVFGGSWIDATLSENLPGTSNTAGNRLAGAPQVNANLGLEYGFELGGRKAWVRADSVYIGEFFGSVLESPNSRAGDYVKVDASARVELPHLSLDLFVRNLTNEDAFSYRRDTAIPLYGNRLRPRTVGLQLIYRF